MKPRIQVWGIVWKLPIESAGTTTRQRDLKRFMIRARSRFGQAVEQ